MSSAILYIAIVAIWAVVLVPRWLRPRAAPPSPQPVPVPAESRDAELREPASPARDALRIPLAHGKLSLARGYFWSPGGRILDA